MGCSITAGIGIAMFPWKLMESAGTCLFTWLVGYSALLGPIAGILAADYFFVRRTELVLDDLFRHDGRYQASNGWRSAERRVGQEGVRRCTARCEQNHIK